VRLTDVVASYDIWLVTNPDVRNNARVRAVKDALVELLRAAEAELSGASSQAAASFREPSRVQQEAGARLLRRG
jgi:hypothetical protein